MSIFGFMLFSIHSQAKIYSLNVLLDAKIPAKAVAQVFYAFNGLMYLEDNNQVMLTQQNASGKTRFEARIRSTKPIRNLRLDISNKPGDITWTSLELIGPTNGVEYHGRDLSKIVSSFDQLITISESNEGLTLVAENSDPKINIEIPSNLTRHEDIYIFWHWIKNISLSILIAIFAELMQRFCNKKHIANIFLARMLEKTSDKLSDETTIIYRPFSLIVYLLLFVLSIGWISLKLNQSSVGIWDAMYPAEFVERDISFGIPRAIRSDEWDTMTPWILSQVRTGMKSDNLNLGAPGSAMLAGAPYLSPLMLAQPKYWGFLFLDIERGYSWLWAFKSFGTIAAFFTLLLLMTKGDGVISLAGSLAIYGSSYVQWWLSSVPAEVIAGFSAAVVGAVYLLQARKTGGMIFGAVLVSMAVPNLLLHLYPPYLQPLLYLSFFVLIGILGNEKALEGFMLRLNLRMPVIILTLAVMTTLVGLWYVDAADTITLMLNTDYPGHRISAGGGYPLSRLFYGVFESWKLDDRHIPFPPVNPSEASSFWILFPMAPFLVQLSEWKKPAMKPVLLMLVFCLITIAWSSLPIPNIMRIALSNAGWYLTPSTRCEFALAVASTMLMATLIAAIARGEVQINRLPKWVTIGLIFTVVVIFGLYLQILDPEFFNIPRIVMSAIMVAALAWSILHAKRIIYLILIIVTTLPSLTVNPIQSGLSPYFHKSIFQKAVQVSDRDKSLWVVYGSTAIAQGFKASGLSVVNGAHYAPRMSWLDILDPQHKYKNVWNRYAHIDLDSGLPNELPIFKIDVADSYQIKVDVCGSEFQRMGVTHAAYTYLPNSDEMRCLTPVLLSDPSGINLFKIFHK